MKKIKNSPKIYILIFFHFTFASFALGQNDIETAKFISEVLNDISRSKKIFYTEDIGSYYQQKIIKQFKTTFSDKSYLKRNGRFFESDITNDSINFSEQEKTFILNEIEAQNGKIWSENSIENSIFISRESLNNIFRPNVDGWAKYYETYSSGYFTISKPIFLRNNSICIFYYGFHSGAENGSGELAVYEKINGKWRRFSTIFEWIS